MVICSFIFSWILVNWKPIFYFVFSDDKISIKIDKIEKSYEFFQNAIVFPLILSLIYVVVFPYVNQLIHLLTVKAERSKRYVQHNLKKEQITIYKKKLAKFQITPTSVSKRLMDLR